MNKLFRIVGCISYFTLLAPLVGFTLFWLFSITAGNSTHISFPWRDLLYSIVELWVPALIGGILFSIAAFPIGTRAPFMKSRLSRGAVAALAFLCVFGVLILEKVIGGFRISSTLFLLAILGSITGAILGGLYPQWLLPRK